MASQESEFPGLQVRRLKDGSERYYWRANRRALALGFAPSIVSLDPTSEADLKSRLAVLQAEMLQFIAEKEGASTMAIRHPRLRDLFREYRTRPESPFHNVKFNTRSTYSYTLDVIEAGAGDVRLADINLAVLNRWYADARWPEGKKRGAPDHLRKAHGIIAMLRRVISFGVAAEIDGCARLHAILSNSRFEAPKRRTVAMTLDQVQAFISAAVAQGRTSLALATAIQFECAMRQKDVIGEWEPVARDEASSSVTLPAKGGQPYRQWVNGLTWSHISDDWRMTKETTKTGSVVSHDLSLCPMALALLRSVSPERRYGPLIVEEKTGIPYAPNGFQRDWRIVANAAGLPSNLWSMDARAGAATEADEAGADLGAVRVTLGHSDAKTTARYVRGSGIEQSRKVAVARLAHRREK